MVRFRKRRRSQSVLGAPMRLLSARARWDKAGQPVRTDEEVTRIYEDICKPCGYYAPITEQWGRCKLCQCSLNLGSTLNKIRWATESCPDKPPKWKAEVEIEEPIKKTGTARGQVAVPVVVELQRDILQQMSPEERLAEHERRKLERRDARRLAASGNDAGGTE